MTSFYILIIRHVIVDLTLLKRIKKIEGNHIKSYNHTWKPQNEHMCLALKQWGCFNKTKSCKKKKIVKSKRNKVSLD